MIVPFEKLGHFLDSFPEDHALYPQVLVLKQKLAADLKDSNTAHGGELVSEDSDVTVSTPDQQSSDSNEEVQDFADAFPELDEENAKDKREKDVKVPMSMADHLRLRQQRTPQFEKQK